MTVSTWAREVSHAVGFPDPISYKDMPGGTTVIYLECTTCPRPIEWHVSKHYPPEVVKKKLLQKKWDLRKRRCPDCVNNGRKVGRPKIKQPEPKTALATQIEAAFAAKHEPLPTIQIGEHMDARIGINDRNVALCVPADSKFFSAFADENFKPKGSWSIELLRDSPQGEPRVRVYRNALPPGRDKAHGIARGYYDAKTTLFQIQMSKSMVPGAAALGEFRVSEARLVRQDEDSFIFELPKERKAPIIRGKDRETRVASKSGTDVMRQAVEQPKLRAVVEPPAPQQEEPATESPKSKGVTLKQAVLALNAHIERLGDDVTITVLPNGRIKATLEYGG